MSRHFSYAAYFVGQSYLNMLSTTGVNFGNVTFEPGCRNNRHIPATVSIACTGKKITLATAEAMAGALDKKVTDIRIKTRNL